jgi:hypothetical protein
MKEFPVEGEQLKKLLKFARETPLAFGYNPGTTDDDDQFLALHKRKSPEVLGRIAMHDGAGTKAAFGMLSVTGNIVSLHCERALPQLAKRIKRLLRLNHMNLNVKVFDAEGNVVDEIIEDVEPGAAPEESKAETDNKATGQGQPDPAPPPPQSDSRTEAMALAARLKAMQSRVQSAPAPAAAKLTRAYGSAVSLVRAGDLEKAGSMIAQIEAVLARVAPATSGDTAS